MDGFGYLQRFVANQRNSFVATELVATDFITVKNPILNCPKRCASKRLVAIVGVSDATVDGQGRRASTRGSVCMVCEKYFTKQKDTEQNDTESCWSCNPSMCDTCTSNKGANEVTSTHVVVVCLHCNLIKDHGDEDSNCMCLFCQPNAVDGDAHIVMDHETNVDEIDCL